VIDKSIVPSPIHSVSVREYQWASDVSDELVLRFDEIHVWKQDLSLPSAQVEFFRGLLSPDELERLGRFRFDTNRTEYAVSRGTLRALLGAYLGLSPRELHFAYSEYGRPSLAARLSPGLLSFNISHSGEVVLLAFARVRRIGIDVERIRRDFSTSEIAERFFSPAERAALGQLPADDRHNAFFRCWTRKEAFIKALGEGLSHPLDQFDVSLSPGLPAALLATRPVADEARRWSLWDIHVPSCYAGALAAEMCPERA
jgi:4'-phosphopantetheinyl transferase